jgi:argininosuccinate synthase
MNVPTYDKEGFLEMSVSPMKAPDEPTLVEIEFEKGKPIGLNGEKMCTKDIIYKLNEIGGANGIGLLDLVENRLVGMKSRGLYETPAGTILYKALDVLKTICLDKYLYHEMQKMAITFGEVVYNGQWYTPLREALQAFTEKATENCTGTVKLSLYKGNMINAGVTSPYSLYSFDFATFYEDDVYNHKDAQGFINLYGLPVKVKAMMEQKNKQE